MRNLALFDQDARRLRAEGEQHKKRKGECASCNLRYFLQKVFSVYQAYIDRVRLTHWIDEVLDMFVAVP